MDLDNLIARIDKIEDQIISLNKSLSTMGDKISAMDERTSGFLELMREEKKEINRLNSLVVGLSGFDGVLTQVRVDLTRKFDDLSKEMKKKDQLHSNLIAEDIKMIKAQVENAKTDLSSDFDKKLSGFLEEFNRTLTQLKELESKNLETLKSSEEYIGVINSTNQDLRRTNKQVENMQAQMETSGSVQNEMRVKIEALSNNLRTNESRLNEIISTETERRQKQLEFMDKQSLLQKERERTWNDWTQQFETLSKELFGLLPEVRNQQLGLKKSQADFDEITQQFERRINEITEIYRLMDQRFRKEWDTYKADSEKRWTNISMTFNDKQEGFTDQVQSLKDRMVLIEDNTKEMQEVFMLMSTEIQKGMQNIMKMVNGWMDAFGQVKTHK